MRATPLLGGMIAMGLLIGAGTGRAARNSLAL